MEKNERKETGVSRCQALLRLAGLIVLATVGSVAVVAAICWFAGWEIGSGLTWAGIAAIAAGVLSTLGGWGVVRDPQVMLSQSVSHQSMTARTRQGLGDSLRSYNFAIVTTAAGILCIAVGALL
jgi:hypothetical protein